MIKVKSKGDPFVVTPVIVELAGVELNVFIAKGEGADNHWINAIYYSGISIKNDNPLFLIISNMLKNKEIK